MNLMRFMNLQQDATVYPTTGNSTPVAGILVGPKSGWCRLHYHNCVLYARKLVHKSITGHAIDWIHTLG